jgi:ferritin-like metal-binding protein YciE
LTIEHFFLSSKCDNKTSEGIIFLLTVQTKLITMEAMNDLKALLKHEVQDLVSAEDQIIEAMPAMIEKAKNPELKKALEEHLRVTEKQRSRLDQVLSSFNGEGKEEDNGGEKKGFLSGLFRGGTQKCRGMEGLITEGEKVMGEDMSAEVMDAAIIACAQKIEHYEICGYGTARAYARELKMAEAERLLDETLNEEYDADDRLTALALGSVNEEAEEGSPSNNGRQKSSRASSVKSGKGSGQQSNKKINNSAKKAAPKKTSSPQKFAPQKVAASKKVASKKVASKKVASKKVAAKKAAPKKAASKKG